MSTQQLLKPGIYTEIEGQKLRDMENYEEEAEEFLKSEKTDDKPFFGIDKNFLKGLSVLNSQYPYYILLGGPGIGKSMINNYTLDVLSGKIKLSQVKKEYPEAVASLERIIDRSREYEPRDYLLLPNLAHAMNPITISYTDSEISEADRKIATKFCSTLSKHLNEYAAENRKLIRTTIDYEGFKKWTIQSVAEIFISMYARIGSLSNNYTNKGHLLISDLETGTKIDPYGRLKSKIQFIKAHGESINYQSLKTAAGVQHSTKMDKKGIQINLEANYIPDLVANEVVQLMQTILTTDVVKEDDFVSEEEKISYIGKVFKRVSKEVKEEILTRHEQKELRTHYHVMSVIKNMYQGYKPELELSKTSFKQLTNSIDSLVTDFIKDSGPSNELKGWMNSITEYLSNGNTQISRVLEGMLIEIQQKEREELDKINAQVGKKGNKKSYQQETEIKDKSIYQEIKFTIDHGGVKDVPIENILDTNELLFIEEGQKGYSWTNVTGSLEDIFGTFEGVDEDTPPHKAIGGKGKFFSGGILVFRDSIKDFFTTICEDYQNGTRERFLDYLEDKKMIVVHPDNGTAYTFYAPKMIIASENSYPFVVTINQKDEHQAGLESRFTTVQMQSQRANTKESRLDFQKVVQRAITEQNIRLFGNNEEEYIKLTASSMNMILNSQISNNTTISNSFRDITKFIEETCDYALRMKVKELTEDVFRRQMKDKLPEDIFLRVDNDAYKHEGYFSLTAMPGLVNGLAISPPYGSRHAVISNLTDGRKHRNRGTGQVFVYEDKYANMAGDMSLKGHQLAETYITNLLRNIGLEKGNKKFDWRKQDWVLKVDHEGWFPYDGPSASGAETVSMISELAGEEVFPNRFVTGTVDPKRGYLGIIGGVYYKGLIANRLKQLAEQDSSLGNEFQPYLLFPAANLAELTFSSTFDPFGIKENVVSIPVRTIQELYYLCTCGPDIAEDDIRNITKRAGERFEETKSNIVKRLSEYNI